MPESPMRFAASFKHALRWHAVGFLAHFDSTSVFPELPLVWFLSGGWVGEQSDAAALSGIHTEALKICFKSKGLRLSPCLLMLGLKT